MVTSDKGINLIKSQEGCVLHPYLDIAGVPTIGWGSTIYRNGNHVTMHDPSITQFEAERLLGWQIDIKGKAVTAMLLVIVNQNQFDALVDFAYNEGTGALHGSTLLRLIKANPLDPAIADAFMMWDKYHKDGQLVVSSDLKQRRQLEIDLYFSTSL
jgi:GH24 family phage-related lysozyme (muramidase)